VEQIYSLQPVEDPMVEQSIPEGLYLMERTRAGAVREELQLVGRNNIGEVP